MTHLDDATLVAFRDGESNDPAVEAHLLSCARCRDDVAEARARAEAIAGLLRDLPGASDPAAAKARVRRRLDVERARRPRLVSAGLRRAAAILALSAGAAYALPGSPLRDWMSPRPADVPAASTDGTAETAGSEPGAVPQEAVLVPVEDRLDVRIEGLLPGRDVEVLWLEGATAWITAGSGATYTVGETSATVRTSDGPVRVGIPRSTPRVVLQVNGRVVFEGTGADRVGERMIFPAPGA